MVKAVQPPIGAMNEKLVKMKNVKELKGMHFGCSLRCNYVLPFHMDCVPLLLPFIFMSYPRTLYITPFTSKTDTERSVDESSDEEVDNIGRPQGIL